MYSGVAAVAEYNLVALLRVGLETDGAYFVVILFVITGFFVFMLSLYIILKFIINLKLVRDFCS
jgi:phage shock protein PspC (stress-responsive transcriptional regulator)